MPHLHRRVCSLCDAQCGLVIELDDGEITRIRGDRDDPFSMGHVCPKAVALQDLYTDPDRLRTPLVRRDGELREASWDEALDEAARRLAAVRREHGKDAVGVYLGNPNAHHFGNLFAIALLAPTLDTANRYSATSVDNLPHMFAALHMFGHQLVYPVPDVDRTDHMLVLGANPWVANGGGMSSGDVRQRLKGIQERGGRIVVLDPRRTETAEIADAHHFLRPGSDALLLLAMLHVLFDEDRIDGGDWRTWATGLDALGDLAATWRPERVAQATGLAPETIRTLARELAAAPRAVVYARLGACTQTYGGLAAWLAVVVTAVTGNLDRPGGLMFSRPAVDTVGITAMLGEGGSYEPDATRSGLPAFSGERPVAALADEIASPGEGQVRALVTVAGNPVLSAPNGRRLEGLLPGLETLVCVDLYLNETSRLADVVLPATSPLQRDHYPLGLASISVRNRASYAPALFEADGGRDDWLILTELCRRLAAVERRPWALALRALQSLGPRRVLDGMLRFGPYGRWRGGTLDLATLERQGTADLGPLEPSLPGRLKTPDGRAHLAPLVLLEDVRRLEAALDRGDFAVQPVLIGRRHLRSNNSWMHNSPRLVKGKPVCTLLVHPDDAEAAGLADGGDAVLRSRTGEVRVPVQVSDEIMPGVVSLPHGWGHHRDGARLDVAAAHAGVSANDVTDDRRVDALTGTAAFSGTPVTIEAAG